MINTNKRKSALYARRRNRVKSKFDRFDGTPRLVVTRSNKNLVGQVIDDIEGRTLVSASSLEKELRSKIKPGTSKVEVAKEIGKIIGARAVEAKIEAVVFDRNGYLYHGRVKALAEAAREAGLKF